jgi:hypothetical protein
MSDIYLSLTETPSVVTLSQPVIGSSVAATVTVGNTVTVALDANSLAALESVTVTVGNVTIGSSVSISNFPSTQTIAGTVTASIANSVTIGSLPYTTTITGVGSNFGQGGALAGSTVTAVPVILSSQGAGGAIQGFNGTNAFLNVGIQNVGGTSLNGVQTGLPISGTVTVGNSVTIGSLPSISGTVTANTEYDKYCNIYQSPPNNAVQLGYAESGNFFVNVRHNNGLPVQVVSQGSVTIGAMPSGALTTRFGSVTTANTAQLTSAVTNTSRKYLLVQNIATSTVTIGIGFAPTTTQGIQLTAGAGLTFDAFTPTGAIYWLSSVTGSSFSILEG